MTTPARWADLFRGGLGVYTIALALGMALNAMDAFVVSTVMPSVVADIGGSEFYTWVVTLYLTMSIVGAASGGPVKLIFGSRRGYVAAALIFLIGTLISGSAPTMPVLLAGRLVQGLGVGMIVAQNIALIGDLFPPELRARMFAMVAGVWAASALAGPLVGGVFAELGWWRGAFWFAVPVTLWFTITAWRVIPDVRAADDRRLATFPIWRVALLGAGVLAIGITGNVETLLLRLLALGSGIGLIWLTIRLDRRADNHVFPSRPFSLAGPVGTAYWALLLISMAPISLGLFMPLAFQAIHGLSPLVAGYLGAMLSLGWSSTAFITANLKGRAERIAMVGGPALTVCGLAGIAVSIGSASIGVLIALTVLVGMGVGFAMAHLMSWTILLATPGEESITASSIHTVRSLGFAIAAAIAGLIANIAGLGGGVSVSTVVAAVSGVAGIFALAPIAVVLLGVLLIRHRRRRPPVAAAGGEPASLSAAD